MTTVIMRTTARVVTPIILLVALELFVQGHNLPGGGFIGGVLTTTAFALLYVAYGIDFMEESVLGRENEGGPAPSETRIITAYRHVFTFGLVVALAGGLVPVLLGYPFLSQTFVIYEHVPIYHEVELASALVFDLGVFCVVSGSILAIISAVGAK
ncbi:MnhB domain-containing protein [Haloferacaceae archaeon DSL9]